MTSIPNDRYVYVAKSLIPLNVPFRITGFDEESETPIISQCDDLDASIGVITERKRCPDGWHTYTTSVWNADYVFELEAYQRDLREKVQA